MQKKSIHIQIFHNFLQIPMDLGMYGAHHDIHYRLRKEQLFTSNLLILPNSKSGLHF